MQLFEEWSGHRELPLRGPEGKEDLELALGESLIPGRGVRDDGVIQSRGAVSRGVRNGRAKILNSQSNQSGTRVGTTGGEVEPPRLRQRGDVPRTENQHLAVGAECRDHVAVGDVGLGFGE